MRDCPKIDSGEAFIKECELKDAENMYEIINDAANRYLGVIPDDCYHEPYMPMDELLDEIHQMAFFGYVTGQKLVGVMGLQRVKDVTLIRHAYVLRDWQGKGIGSELLEHLLKLTTTENILVGTWADAYWAIDFYKEHGFELLPNKDELLRRYWKISSRQRKASVVLGFKVNRIT